MFAIYNVFTGEWVEDIGDAQDVCASMEDINERYGDDESFLIMDTRFRDDMQDMNKYIFDPSSEC